MITQKGSIKKMILSNNQFGTFSFQEYKKTEAAVFYKKKEFLKIWQNSQENNCARVSFLINFILRNF